MDISGANVSSKSKGNARRRTLLWIAIGSLFVLSLAVYASPLDLRCVPLLIHSIRDVDTPLPEGCSFVKHVQSDPLVQYLENERRNRHLIFKGWVTCAPLEPNQTRDFVMLRDPRWMPGYVGQTYQLRRTVILFPYVRVSPGNSPVVAELCIVPWLRYASQIAGECNGKFSAWK